MNKAAIQRFAIWARTELIAQVSQRAYQYGITKDGYGEANAVTVGGRALSTDEQRQRKELVEQIRRKGYTQVMEEVAYTWFNRFIALRFMEVNNYLPSHIRVFSDSTGAFKPEILNDVLHLDLPGLNADKVAEFIEGNQTEALYRYLLLTQCNALNSSLPRMFEQMGGYTELLLPNNILKQDSVLSHMVTDIPEEDWTDQVQIIGWLYQYYNSELKDDTFALLKKNVKITKERIPSATQLFTPDWIVRYMVENSLGRIFIDKRKNEGVFADGRGADEMTWDEVEQKRISNEEFIAEQMGWKYYLPEAAQTQEVRAQLDKIQAESSAFDVKSIKVIDPCMGSGHILVYAFDILIQIYKEYGVSERDAAQSILQNNLYGLDIDDRAAQLAYFAVMMKARQYDRRIFTRGIQPNVYSIVESNGLDSNTIDYFTNNDPKLKKDFGTLVDELRDAKEYGSILDISRVDFAVLYARVEEVRGDISLFREMVLNEVEPLICIAEVMAQKYDVVVTNPPYMAVSNAGAKVNDYVKANYPESKADLFAVFMERCLGMLKKDGLEAMITQQSFLFAPSFTKFRDKVVFDRLINLIHIGFNSFPELNSKVALGAAFVMSATQRKNFASRYLDLNSAYPPSSDKEEAFFSERSSGYFANSSLFNNIPNHAVTYSFSKPMLMSFASPKIEAHIVSDGQTKTGNNDKYMRNIWEIQRDKIGKDKKWSLIAKGGDSRKWYGNILDLIDWSETARRHYKADKVARIAPEYIWFRPGICWNHIATSKGFAARLLCADTLFETASPAILIDDDEIRSIIMAFLNTPITRTMMELLNPSVCKNVGDVTGLPLISLDAEHKEKVLALSTDNQALSKEDWDLFELSWDFSCHPLVSLRGNYEEAEVTLYADNLEEGVVPIEYAKASSPIAQAFDAWERLCDDRYYALKSNEEAINRIFIDIYGLQDELTAKIADKDVTIRRADLGRDIRSLISYAVGCMFGRYSLDMPGLAYAGGEWDASKYTTIIPDKDNIIPICDDDYFDDDITGRFVKWVEAVYGKDTLEENLKFISDALGGKGTPREVIRNYFINDFYADHLKIYQKRPIYWLFDSGKKNGFKALIYMHRYQSDLLAKMRTDYVHEQQERYRTQLSHLADAIDHASASERVKLTKQQKKIQEQALEIQKYEEKVHHLADRNISIDLDDGVKHNYELFADVLAKIK